MDWVARVKRGMHMERLDFVKLIRYEKIGKNRFSKIGIGISKKLVKKIVKKIGSKNRKK